MNPREVSAILLAGGYSSRMGREKAELLFHGKSFVQHQTDTLCTLGVGEILLSGYAAPVSGTRFVPDRYPHCGPLSGIHAGLLTAEHEAALVLAVDTPLVPSTLLEELLRVHREGITIVSCGGEWEPLIGVYDKALAPFCEELLRGENHSLRKLFGRAPFSVLEYGGDPLLLMNCNTSEDYERLCAYKATDR